MPPRFIRQLYFVFLLVARSSICGDVYLRRKNLEVSAPLVTWLVLFEFCIGLGRGQVLAGFGIIINHYQSLAVDFNIFSNILNLRFMDYFYALDSYLWIHLSWTWSNLSCLQVLLYLLPRYIWSLVFLCLSSWLRDFSVLSLLLYNSFWGSKYILDTEVL